MPDFSFGPVDVSYWSGGEANPSTPDPSAALDTSGARPTDGDFQSTPGGNPTQNPATQWSAMLQNPQFQQFALQAIRSMPNISGMMRGGGMGGSMMGGGNPMAYFLHLLRQLQMSGMNPQQNMAGQIMAPSLSNQIMQRIGRVGGPQQF